MKLLAISCGLFFLAKSSLVSTKLEVNHEPELLDDSVDYPPEEHLILDENPVPILGSEEDFSNMCGNFKV